MNCCFSSVSLHRLNASVQLKLPNFFSGPCPLLARSFCLLFCMLSQANAASCVATWAKKEMVKGSVMILNTVLFFPSF